MKRSGPVVWILLAVVLAGLVLLVDPFALFGAGRDTVPFAPPSPGSDATASDVGIDPRPDLEEVAEAAVPAAGETVERRTVDPLVEAGLASFRVVVSPDRPIAAAQVLVVRDGELVDDGLTDDRGEVAFGADARPAGLVIAIEHRPLEWRDVVLDVGRQDIVLAEGGHLSGRFVLEDGSSPGPLRPALDSDHPLSSVAIPLSVEDALTVRALHGGYVVVRTDAEGRFEFTGLPDSWSGRLWVGRGWKVASTSHGDILPRAAGLRLTEPASDIVVHIEPHRTLHGRLVFGGDGSPLGGARLATMLRSPDTDTPTFAGAVTDDEGHFGVEVRDERISRFELRLGGSFHECPSILSLDGADLPADGDLGEIVVDGVRHVPFLVQDTAGDPVAGAVAVAAGTRSTPTGKDGLGELRWLASSVVRLVVEAPGFVPAEREIPAVVVDPLVVTLEAANELLVTLRLPAGADPTNFKVVLRGDERITAVPVTDAAGQRRHVSEWAYPLVELMQAAHDTYLVAHPDARTAHATFRALRVGVEIELRIHGRTGDMVYHREPLEPFGPAEQREVEVSLEEGMIAFRGRVLDQDGNPLAGAWLQLTNQILGRTDDGGNFLCFLATAETGTLLVQHRACTTKYLHDYAVPTDGHPVEFRLSAARSVSVEVVDENGDPVPQAAVWRQYGGFTSNTHRVEGHRHLASSVPEAPFDFVVRLSGREYRQEHDPAIPEARIVVPVHGRVVALVPDTATAGRSGRFVLVLEPAPREPGEPGGPVTESRESTSNLRIDMPAVHPGTYRASLRYVPSKAEREAGREESSSESVPVVVEASRETEVRLAFPAVGG